MTRKKYYLYYSFYILLRNQHKRVLLAPAPWRNLLRGHVLSLRNFPSFIEEPNFAQKLSTCWRTASTVYANSIFAYYSMIIPLCPCQYDKGRRLFAGIMLVEVCSGKREVSSIAIPQNIYQLFQKWFKNNRYLIFYRGRQHK